MILHAIVLLVAATVHSHKIVGAPHFNRRVFIMEASLLAVAKSADMVSTQRLVDRGGWENNPVFGRHPSPARLASINAGIFAAQVGVVYLTEHSRHAWVRWAGRAFIAHAIIEHGYLTACNAGIDTHATRVQNCRPLMPF